MSHGIIAQSMENRKSAFKIVHKPLLWKQNTLIYRWFVKKSPFECTLVLISIPVTTSAHTINVTYHSTADGEPEISVQDCPQAVAMATKNTLIYRLFVKEIPIWMHTRPDFNLCDGLCTHNQCHMS